MKKTFFILGLLFSTCAIAQVIIGNKTGNQTITNSSVSLEFGDYANARGRGFIMPWVTSVDDLSGAVNGTLAFDTKDKILKYKKANTWFSLTQNKTTNINGVQVNTTGQVNTTLQDNLSDLASAKTTIGANNADPAPGILVLSDANKAMVLPKVPEPHKNIINPEPGTIVYDTTNKMLAVFNGKIWFFWKP